MAESMVERAGHAARIAAPRYAVSTYGQARADGKHVVWEVAVRDWPIAFSGSHEECEAWVNAYVGRAAIAAMRNPPDRMLGIHGLMDQDRARHIRVDWGRVIECALATDTADTAAEGEKS